MREKFPFSSDGIEREILNTPVYGMSANEVTFSRPTHIDEVTWNGLSQGMRRLIGVRGQQYQGASTGSYYKTLEMEETFVDDPTTNDSLNPVIVADPFMPFAAHNWWYKVERGERLFPRKRQIIFAGSRLLSDGPSPFWHGQYPFATLQFNPVFWSFWGLSKYRDLLPLNIAMNEIVAAVLDLIKRALNPIAITKEGAVSQAAWKTFFPDMPGFKLRVGANEQLSNALRYMEVPQIPQYVLTMLQGWLAPEYDRLAGSVDVNNLGKKKQVPSGDSIDVMRDTQNTALRLEERQLEVFLRDAGKQVVSNEIQFTSADYRMQVLGEAGLVQADFNGDPGNMLPEDRAAQPDFHKQFAMTISAGSLHSGAKDKEKQVAAQLAGKQLLPIVDMYQRLEIPDPQAVYKRLIQQHQDLGAGKKPVSGKREK